MPLVKVFLYKRPKYRAHQLTHEDNRYTLFINFNGEVKDVYSIDTKSQKTHRHHEKMRPILARSMSKYFVEECEQVELDNLHGYLLGAVCGALGEQIIS